MICKICNKECKSLSKHLHHAHKFTIDDKINYYDKYIEPNNDHLCICGKKLKFSKFSYMPTCGCKECKFKQISVTKLSYTKEKKIHIINKIHQTKLERYGDENYNNHDLFKQSCLEKFGAESPLAIKENHEIGKITKLEKYGDENYNNRIKAEQTCITKYGARHHFQNKEIFDKCKHKIHKYNEIFDSSWELLFYEYLRNDNIDFVFHPDVKMFYEYNGKIHRYYPDFLVNGEYIEIKGDHLLEKIKILGTLENAKYNCMIENHVKILTGKDIEEINDKIKIKEMD